MIKNPRPCLPPFRKVCLLKSTQISGLSVYVSAVPKITLIFFRSFPLFYGFFVLKSEAVAIGTDKHGYGGILFGFEPHGPATMGELLLPGDIVIFALMTVDS